MGINPIVLGKGDTVVNQYPKAKTSVVSYDKVFLLTNDKKMTMPNLQGYTRAEAINICELLDLPYEIKGYGTVTSQSISAGSPIKDGSKIVISLDNKTKFN